MNDSIDIREGETTEVWCERCERPTEGVVNGHPLCHEHTLDALWRLRSKSWAGSPERAGAH